MNETQKSLSRIEELINFEKIDFSKLSSTMTSFFDEKMLLKIEIENKKISDSNLQKIKKYASFSKDFIDHKIDSEEFKKIRVNAWKEYDSSQDENNYRNLIRVLICCLYDEESAEFNAYGPEAIIETFLSCLEDFDKIYCDQFSSYLIERF
jgi:hypothetical protein